MKKILILLNLAICLVAFPQEGVSITPTGNDPDASAMLDVVSSNKGLLIPRIELLSTDNNQPVASPAVSLLIYNKVNAGSGATAVSKGYYYWNGTEWTPFVVGNVVGTDDQLIDSLTLNGLTLSAYIEDGGFKSVDLTAVTDSAFSLVFNNADSLFSNSTFLDSLSTFITNNNTGFDNQNITGSNLSGTNLTIGIENGTSEVVDLSTLVNDADADPTNEIEIPTGGSNGQVLSTDGSGTYTWVTPSSGTDNQDLSLTGNTLALTNDGTTVDLSTYLDNTDNQDLSLTGNTLALTNDGTTVDLSTYIDNTDNQDLSLTGNTLAITNDGTTVDLSMYLDNTDAQTLSLSGNTLSISGGNNVTLPNNADGDAWAVNGEDVASDINRTGDVGIGAAPHSSASLDLSSTNKGFLINRSDTVNITAPAFGLMTLAPADSCLYIYNGSSWMGIGGGGCCCPVNGAPTVNVTTNPPPSAYLTSCNCPAPTVVVDVFNPVTGKTWMDRNLGASRAATSFDDELAYGYLFQWGRSGYDGHQCRSSEVLEITNGVNNPQIVAGFNSSSVKPHHNKFIAGVSAPNYSWYALYSSAPLLWQGVAGKNNPCPSGYRLPTSAEMDAERLSWGTNDIAGAFGSPLKLVGSGWRSTAGLIRSRNEGFAWYWTSTTPNAMSNQVSRLDIQGANASIVGSYKAAGAAVRCIKN